MTVVYLVSIYYILIYEKIDPATNESKNLNFTKIFDICRSFMCNYLRKGLNDAS
jgi:hypothetical protein